MLTDDDTNKLIYRAFGALIGVMASMVMIAPEGTRNALYRVVVSVICGTIFAPVAGNIFGFLDGPEWELVLARGTATGFSVWFILEAFARLFSTNWIDRLIVERLRLKGDGK